MVCGEQGIQGHTEYTGKNRSHPMDEGIASRPGTGSST